MSMIERVAQAIAKAELEEGDTTYSWHALTEEIVDCYYVLARAAIEAMREPTNQMVDDQGGEYVNLERADDQSYQPRLIWQGMVDTALEEK